MKFKIKREIYKFKNINNLRNIIKQIQIDMDSDVFEVESKMKTCDLTECFHCNVILMNNIEHDKHLSSCKKYAKLFAKQQIHIHKNYGVRKMKSSKIIKDKLIDFLIFDDLSDFEKKLMTDNKALEKHFNLRIFIKNDIEDKLIQSIGNNLFTETITNKITRIKICKDLLAVLEINNLTDLTKDITKKFKGVIINNWLNDNIMIVKKMFNIRTEKYDDFNYYNIYLLLMTVLKNLFDKNLFTKHFFEKNNVDFVYYVFDENVMNNHNSIINKLNNFADFIN